jgi:hypothetical protein
VSILPPVLPFSVHSCCSCLVVVVLQRILVCSPSLGSSCGSQWPLRSYVFTAQEATRAAVKEQVLPDCTATSFTHHFRCHTNRRRPPRLDKSSCAANVARCTLHTGRPVSGYWLHGTAPGAFRDQSSTLASHTATILLAALHPSCQPNNSSLSCERLSFFLHVSRARVSA